jgi:hypothetical protein
MESAAQTEKMPMKHRAMSLVGLPIAEHFEELSESVQQSATGTSEGTLPIQGRAIGVEVQAN